MKATKRATTKEIKQAVNNLTNAEGEEFYINHVLPFDKRSINEILNEEQEEEIFQKLYKAINPDIVQSLDEIIERFKNNYDIKSGVAIDILTQYINQDLKSNYKEV